MVPCSIHGGGGDRAAEYRRYNKNRGSAAANGYDFAWRRTREQHLRMEPLCRMCKAKGFVTAATLVDHIIPLAQGGERLDHANLQSLDSRCHSIKSADDARRLKSARR